MGIHDSLGASNSVNEGSEIWGEGYEYHSYRYFPHKSKLGRLEEIQAQGRWNEWQLLSGTHRDGLHDSEINCFSQYGLSLVVFRDKEDFFIGFTNGEEPTVDTTRIHLASREDEGDANFYIDIHSVQQEEYEVLRDWMERQHVYDMEIVMDLDSREYKWTMGFED
jgi:hypothetical protein